MNRDPDSPQIATPGKYASSASGEPAPPPRRPRQGDAMYARAFSAGSDARLAGRPLTANPYGRGSEDNEHKGWQAGWVSVDSSWGSHPIHGRWTVRPLLDVSPNER